MATAASERSWRLGSQSVQSIEAGSRPFWMPCRLGTFPSHPGSTDRVVLREARPLAVTRIRRAASAFGTSVTGASCGSSRRSPRAVNVAVNVGVTTGATGGRGVRAAAAAACPVAVDCRAPGTRPSAPARGTAIVASPSAPAMPACGSVLIARRDSRSATTFAARCVVCACARRLPARTPQGLDRRGAVARRPSWRRRGAENRNGADNGDGVQDRGVDEAGSRRRARGPRGRAGRGRARRRPRHPGCTSSRPGQPEVLAAVDSGAAATRSSVGLAAAHAAASARAGHRSLHRERRAGRGMEAAEIVDVALPGLGGCRMTGDGAAGPQIAPPLERRVRRVRRRPGAQGGGGIRRRVGAVRRHELTSRRTAWTGRESRTVSSRVTEL